MIGKKFIFRLFCLLSIALIYEFSFIVFALNVPKWDDFALIHTISEFNASSSWFSKIQLLFKQHNEHRIFFTRVLSLLDYLMKKECKCSWRSLMLRIWACMGRELELCILFALKRKQQKKFYRK
jgi:hypothetical protein